MTTNVYNKLIGLFPTDTLSIVTITAHNGDGTSSATTSGGVTVTIIGESIAIGNNAFVRDGEIVRQAPNVTIVTLPI